MTTSAPRSARERVRAELTSEIKAVARRHLAEHGSSALSLRAVSRELGMVSSAVYRYFPSRDELLTALIIDAYDAVASAAEQSERATRRSGTESRWVALSGAIRQWALGAPQEYALIYGSPVPGYAAPPDTIDPAARVSFVFLRLVADGVESGEIAPGTSPPIPRTVHTDFSELRSVAGVKVPDVVLTRAMLTWTQLFGTVSFELFGHLHNVIHDYDAFFELQMRRAAQFLLGGD
jgi:AcrR family transcriptional regulator